MLDLLLVVVVAEPVWLPGWHTDMTDNLSVIKWTWNVGIHFSCLKWYKNGRLLCTSTRNPLVLSNFTHLCLALFLNCLRVVLSEIISVVFAQRHFQIILFKLYYRTKIFKGIVEFNSIPIQIHRQRWCSIYEPSHSK